MISQIESALYNLRNAKPLVLCLTNYVTMDFVANSLLAIGTAPIMSMCQTELEELIHMANAIYINLGTLDDAFISRCHFTAQLAKQLNIPLVLDPVGAGATALRTRTAREFMLYSNIIRGNASEIIALHDDDAHTHGVESQCKTKDALNTARLLAKNLDSTIVVSGATDFITDSHQQQILKFGSPLMARVTGMGCTLTAVIAAFHAVIDNSFEASKIATAYFGLCGNLAHLNADTPGMFRTAFIDALFATDVEKMKAVYQQEALA